MEIRFGFGNPPKASDKQEKDEEDDAGGALPDDDALMIADTAKDGDDAEAASDTFVPNIVAALKAMSPWSAAASAGIVFARLPDVSFVVPRSRFDVEFVLNSAEDTGSNPPGNSYLRLHGKTYDHRIPVSSIGNGGKRQLFLLPRSPTESYFVMGLEQAVRQGQTRYPFLVISLPTHDEWHVTVGEDNNEDAKGSFVISDTLLHDTLHLESRTVSGTCPEVFSLLTKALCSGGCKIVVPGKSFVSRADNMPFLKCTWRASEGFLYALERSLLFLPKPATFIPHSSIARVEVERQGLSGRSFDVRILLRDAGNGPSEYTYGNIAKDELPGFEDYLQAKGIPYGKERSSAVPSKHALSSSEANDEESEEDQSGEEMKKKRSHGKDQDEDDESDDEDYQAESESSVGEEYDEDYESSEDEEGDDEEKSEEQEDEAEESDEE